MYRNLAGQEYHVLLFGKDGRVKDQEAFISVKVSKDGGPYVPLADTAPSEIIGTGGRTGEYAFFLTAAETDYQFLDFELTYTGTVPGVEIAGIPANTVEPSLMYQIYSSLYGEIDIVVAIYDTVGDVYEVLGSVVAVGDMLAAEPYPSTGLMTVNGLNVIDRCELSSALQLSQPFTMRLVLQVNGPMTILETPTISVVADETHISGLGDAPVAYTPGAPMNLDIRVGAGGSLLAVNGVINGLAPSNGTLDGFTLSADIFCELQLYAGFKQLDDSLMTKSGIA